MLAHDADPLEYAWATANDMRRLCGLHLPWLWLVGATAGLFVAGAMVGRMMR